jgi:hypothetical protein
MQTSISTGRRLFCRVLEVEPSVDNGESDIRRICRPIVAAHPIESARAFDDTVEKLFVAAAHREVRYAAVKLAKHPLYRAYQTPDRHLKPGVQNKGACFRHVTKVRSRPF